MDLATINPVTLQPDVLIENYASLIWTERYSKNGDFELKSNDIAAMKALLPLETMVTLRDSTVPMMVEIHKIEKPKNAAPVLTVTGRSFETVLDRRASARTVMGSTKTPWMLPASKESDAAFRAMRIVLGDVAQIQAGIQVCSIVPAAVDAVRDPIPELHLILPADYQTAAWSATITYSLGDLVGVGTTIYRATALGSNLNKPPASEPTYWDTLATGASGSWGASVNYEIPSQDLYSAVMNLITANYHGLKAVRPSPGSSTIGIEIYNGADLTNDIQFDARFDQIDSATYLLSKQGSTNVAYVYGQSGSSRVLKTAAPEPSGLERRVLLLDETGDAASSSVDVQNTRGLIELYNRNVTALFDGQIADYIAVGYNTEYFLGDVIQLVGDYGLYENVRVAEFIRTSDSTGEKAYPTFEVVS